MTKSDLELILTALTYVGKPKDAIEPSDYDLARTAIDIIKKQINEEQTSQEPVGVILSDIIYNQINCDKSNGRVMWCKSLDDFKDGANLYAYPWQEQVKNQDTLMWTEMVFPELPDGFEHEKFGTLYDAFQMQQYAIECLKLATNPALSQWF